jgi:hypothetical protein
MSAKALLAAALILAALVHPCAAALPNPGLSHCDPILVGNSSGHDMGNTYHVVVRDVATVPVTGRPVAIWFQGASARPDVTQEAGSTTDCTALTITRMPDATGTATFHASFAGFDNTKTVRILAGGVLLALIPVRSTDLDGNGTTDLNDLNAFRQRFLFDRTAPETDFDQNGVTNGYDFNLFRVEFLAGVTNTVCP